MGKIFGKIHKSYFLAFIVTVIGHCHCYDPDVMDEFAEIFDPTEPDNSIEHRGHTIVIVEEMENSIERNDDGGGENTADRTHLVNPCRCEEELNQLRDKLVHLTRELQTYKETELERFYKLSKRIQFVVNSLESGRLMDAQKQMNFLHDHLWEVDVLQRVAETVLLAAANSPKFNTTMLASAMDLAMPKDPQLRLPIIYSFFNYQDEAKRLENPNILRATVLAIKKVLQESTKSQIWTKEMEIKLINRIFVNVCNAMGSVSGPWIELRAWLNKELFRAFVELTEKEALEVALDTIEVQSNDGLSSSDQLRYLKMLYHDCSTAEGLIHHHYWYVVDVFARPFIFNSIDRDILSRIGVNGTDAGDIGLRYFEELARDWNEALEDEYFTKENILFGHIAEVFLHAMQSNAMTFDPQNQKFWKLIKIFGPLEAVLLKYPFLSQEIKVAVVDKYGNASNRIEDAVSFIQDIPAAFSYISYKQLLSSMRENGHLSSPQIFRLAAIFMTAGLRNDSIWSEIPEQAQLISDYATDKGLIWTVRFEENSYEVFATEEDLYLRLKPVNSEAEMGPHRIWIFDPVSSIKGPTKITISLADFLPPHFGGIVVDPQEDGTKLLRHIGGLRDRKNGKFAYFVPQLSERLDSVHLFFNGEPLGLVFDADGEVEGVGIPSASIPAHFVLVREE